MSLSRRDLLRGLSLASFALPTLLRAGPTERRKRVVFFVTPHGHVPSSWDLGQPQGNTPFERELTGLPAEQFSAVLKPLYSYRSRLLGLGGLSHATALFDIAEVLREGSGDINNHAVGVADLLTCARAAQHAGFPCTGGAQSVDQLLGARLNSNGSTRVFGGEYVPNQTVAAFSFLGDSQAAALTTDPTVAFHDLTAGLGASVSDPMVRARLSVLDATASEYQATALTLAGADRQKLEAHRDLVVALQHQLAMTLPTCDTTFDSSGSQVRQFMRLIRLAFACDLARVVAYVAPVPACPEFGFPASSDVHGTYAHASVPGDTSCGQTYSPTAEQAMTALSAWYAGHVAALAGELDSVPSPSGGTLLDDTIIVWLTELGTPTHRHTDAFVTLVGGGADLQMGRYLCWPGVDESPLQDSKWKLGPAHSRLLLQLFRALGQSDDHLGLASATTASGAPIDLVSPLPGL